MRFNYWMNKVEDVLVCVAIAEVVFLLGLLLAHVAEHGVTC